MLSLFRFVHIAIAAWLGVGRAAEKEFPAFATHVRPFVQSYCLDCHDKETRKGDLDLSTYEDVDGVVKGFGHWELVLERLRNEDMPPAKSKRQPSAEERKAIIRWIEELRAREAQRTAGDPGPVLPRRLSNAELNNSILALTRVDIQPARTFPVDPANQAGFDNSGESLAMSPALVKKYLAAAREVSEHLALQPDGFTFAPHAVVADTDRDKWAVFRIVDFYRRQPTDLADYFEAAWRFRHRKTLGIAAASLEDVAQRSKVSVKYLNLIWATLNDAQEKVGPIAKLQAAWDELPADAAEARAGCEAMRNYVLAVRSRIIPEVKNLAAPPIQEGSQTLVLWKDREMAKNRRRFNPGALITAEQLTNVVVVSTNTVATKGTNGPARRKNGHVQAETPDIVKKGGFAFAPTLVTKESSATERMAAAKKQGADPELVVPSDPEERARYEAAFSRFADIFPDAFYITERARVYLDAEKEQENAGRLLSAGLHSMTGYFRDDAPLYDLILDEAGQKELDRLWNEFDFISSVPQRMHTSLLWFERTDSAYLRDPEFDPYRPEDKSALSQEKIRRFAELYLDKARKNKVSEKAERAIEEHFAITAANIARVEEMHKASEPTHLRELVKFAERAYRRPLSDGEREDLLSFYRVARQENGVDHEEAVRDCIVRVLVSPKFLFRMDLVAAAGNDRADGAAPSNARGGFRRPLSDFALASRLSYLLWASMPDEELLAAAARGELHEPSVIRAQARRLLKDARVRNLGTEFAGNWLDFRRFEEINSVDRERFPAFNNELRKAMFEEPLRFFVDVAQRDRSVLDFIYGEDTFVNGALAKHYGVSPAPEGTNTWVHLEKARAYGRGGVLPMAAFLTANSPGLRTSPVKRGNWVVKRILGERIPPPPPIVPELPKDEKAMGNLTLREALAMHRERAGCRECHARFDSLGLVFESYGPVGELRQLDLGGRSVDTHARFPSGRDGEGLGGLIDYIRESRESDFIDNLCRKLLAFALSRTLILGDESLVEEMRANLKASGYRFGSLIETIVSSPQFLNTRGPAELAKN